MRIAIGILLSTLCLVLSACSFKSEPHASTEAQTFPLENKPIVAADNSTSSSLPNPNSTAQSQQTNPTITTTEPLAANPTNNPAPAIAGAGASMSVSSDLSKTAINSAPPSQAAPATGKQLQAGSILVNQPVGKTWGQVGGALKAAGFEIMQQDNSLNAYFVADKKASGGKYAGDTPVLQVKLLPVGQTTMITIQEASGASAGSDTLKRLYNNLP